jgi:elongation factor Ts
MKNSKTVDENLVALISKMGEKITIGRSKTFNHNGSKNFNYLHTIVKDNLSKLAVLVSIETKNDSDHLKTFGKQLSMHIAASSPLAVEVNSIKKEVLEKEITLISEELKGTGKPENIIKKISTGKINKFMKDNAILSQPWVMEPKKNVQDIIKELNITDLKIKDFYRLKIGE